MGAPSEQRPGGWVPGIGWVALLSGLPIGTEYLWSEMAEVVDERTVALVQPVIVTRWADGEVPSAPPPSDELVETEWVYRPADGLWTRPAGDGSIEIDLFNDEIEDFPPLVEARREIERLRAALDAGGAS